MFPEICMVGAKVINLAPNISALVLNCRRSDEVWPLYRQALAKTVAAPKIRARNNGRSTDNVQNDCGFDRSNFRLAGHVERSKFNRIENEINLRFLLFGFFSCYLWSRCVLRNFDMKSW